MSTFSDLAEKVVVVTGANGDIGIAIARKFLEQQSNVYAFYHTDNSLLLSLKEKYKDKLHIIQCDITNPSQLESKAEQILSEAGRADTLINNAGINRDNLFSTMSNNDFDIVIKTNLYGTFYCCQTFLRLLRKAEHPSIVNISSISGLTSSFGQTNYSAAKAAILGFSRTLAAELAQKNIRVNIVAPGLIDSRMVKRVPRHITRQVISAIALKRMGTVDEVANVVTFLASETSSYIVGQTIVVDGGLIMR